MMIVLVTICCRFGMFVQTLSKKFGQDFEVEVQARFATGVWPFFFADFDDVDRVGSSLLQFLKLRFGHKAKFYSDLELG